MVRKAVPEKSLVVAMDHARNNGPIAGLEDPGKVIETVIEAGADAIMTTYGVVKKHQDRLRDRVPFLLRLDGGPSIFREDWLCYTEWELLHSVEDAVKFGAAGVCIMAFIGGRVELSTLRNVARVAAECEAAGLQLVVEALGTLDAARISNIYDKNVMAAAARIAFEHGADLIKTYYTGSVESFRYVTSNCPVPCVIAGGEKMGSIERALEIVAESIEAGGHGVVFGRNIWQNPHPQRVVRAMRQIIHEGADVKSAMRSNDLA